MQSDQVLRLEGPAPEGVLIPPEMFAHYLPHLGYEAIGLWAALMWLEKTQEKTSFGELAARASISTSQVEDAFARLVETKLVEVGEGKIRLLPPVSSSELEEDLITSPSLPRENLKDRKNNARDPVESEAAAAQEPVFDIEADMQAVLDIYHKRVGLIGPSQLDKLRFWVETKSMSAEVVAMAIEEMLKKARNPRVEYLEGILRNWYNDGIRDLSDLLEKQQAEEDKRGEPPAVSKGYEGMPNAQAYSENADLIKKWRELYGSGAE